MVKRLKGTSILSVALDLRHHAFVMDIGRIVRSGSGAELLADPIVRDAYLGVLEQ
jgi:branched-chain amino acid transport system ATP-binding protein